MPLQIAVTGQALLHGAFDLAAPGIERVREVLQRADVAFANLEASLETPGAWPTKPKTLHLTGADGIAALQNLGFQVLTHANNHAFDLGPPGLKRTREVVEAAGLHLAGSGENLAQASEPAIVRAAGGSLAILAADLGPQPEIVYAAADRAGINPLRLRRRVVVPRPDYDTLKRIVSALGDDRREAARLAVGYRAARGHIGDHVEVFGTIIRSGSAVESRFEPDPEDLFALKAGIAQAKQAASLVAVALHGHHWEPDWGVTPGWLLDLARDLIDGGADLVVGTGAPVLQPLFFHGGKPILAGLGNFIFHTRRSEIYDRQGLPVWSGTVVRCTFEPRESRCTKVEILPIAVGQPGVPAALAPAPMPLDSDAAEKVFALLTSRLDAREKGFVRRIEG